MAFPIKLIYQYAINTLCEPHGGKQVLTTGSRLASALLNGIINSLQVCWGLGSWRACYIPLGWWMWVAIAMWLWVCAEVVVTFIAAYYRCRRESMRQGRKTSSATWRVDEKKAQRGWRLLIVLREPSSYLQMYKINVSGSNGFPTLMVDIFCWDKFKTLA